MSLMHHAVPNRNAHDRAEGNDGSKLRQGVIDAASKRTLLHVLNGMAVGRRMVSLPLSVGLSDEDAADVVTAVQAVLA